MKNIIFKKIIILLWLTFLNCYVFSQNDSCLYNKQWRETHFFSFNILKKEKNIISNRELLNETGRNNVSIKKYYGKISTSEIIFKSNKLINISEIQNEFKEEVIQIRNDSLFTQKGLSSLFLYCDEQNLIELGIGYNDSIEIDICIFIYTLIDEKQSKFYVLKEEYFIKKYLETFFHKINIDYTIVNDE